MYSPEWHHVRVKRALFVLLSLLIATATLADERSEKRQLISELLEILDAKALMQRSVDGFVDSVLAMGSAEMEGMDDEHRAEWEEARKQQDEQMRAYRERMFTRIDYAKYFDEVYVPMFEKQFTADELRQLIAFFGTKHGQKVAKILPDFNVFSRADGMRILTEAATETQQEIEKEETAKHPWKRTMADMRTLATAVEARATDTEDYPKVDFEELETLIAPTYIRHVPKTDGWGTPFLFVSDGTHYRFVSAGADKRFEWSARQLARTSPDPIASESFDADLIFQDGEFIQFPKEAQQQ